MAVAGFESLIYANRDLSRSRLPGAVAQSPSVVSTLAGLRTVLFRLTGLQHPC